MTGQSGLNLLLCKMDASKYERVFPTSSLSKEESLVPGIQTMWQYLPHCTKNKIDGYQCQHDTGSGECQFLFLAHTHVDSPPPSALNHKCHILALLLWSEEVMTWPVGVHAEITDHHIFLNEGLKIHQPKCCDKNNIDQETHLKESMYNRKFHN